MKQEELIKNIDKLHTTLLGIKRIKKNLNLNNEDVIKYLREIILDNNTIIYKHGKNWYCENKGIKITINASSYTIITVHQMNWIKILKMLY